MNLIISGVSNNNFASKNKISFGHSFFLKDVTLPCAYCGRKMLSIKNISTMASILESRRGHDAIAVLHNHYGSLDKKQQIIIDILSDEIKASPKTPVKTLIENLAKRFETVTNVQYSEVIENAFKKSEINRRSPLGKILHIIIENSQKSLLSNIVNSKQKTLRITELRKNLIDLINYSRSKKDKIKLQKFMRSVESDFGYIKQDPHSFFAKFGYEPIKSFLGSLFSSVRSTADHIVTASRNGPSESSNYIAVCGTCNWSRSEVPFRKFVKHKPRVIANIKRQFALLDSLLVPEVAKRQRISDGCSENIFNYLSIVPKRLQEEIGTPIEFNLPNLKSRLG